MRKTTPNILRNSNEQITLRNFHMTGPKNNNEVISLTVQIKEILKQTTQTQQPVSKV